MKTTLIFLIMMTLTISCRPAFTESTTTEVALQDDIIKLVSKNDIQGVRNALEDNIDVNSKDANKRSLLLIATKNGNIEMAKLLVKYGADVNLQADNMDSPFLYAGASGQTELVKLFLDHGARFDLFNRYNGTALIPACERGHVETVKLLANTKNFPLDHVNRLGWTALMEAIVLGDGSKKYQEIVRILKDAGAKLDIPDFNGTSPLQHAQQRGYTEIIVLLTT
ncbi:ankyrin repeat domain-containing protein [Sphingobacterium sp. UBA5670]|uniref:ankyrin repeat domain-containing protein n=1 Tax=Sphingobacterium sp. UBA5670 TaxID=1947502 RepID=UPI0025F749D9|nr:ankyrin repeat domain-containing protein [Sphingobacterium sp. UBA5670]